METPEVEKELETIIRWRGWTQLERVDQFGNRWVAVRNGGKTTLVARGKVGITPMPRRAQT